MSGPKKEPPAPEPEPETEVIDVVDPDPVEDEKVDGTEETGTGGTAEDESETGHKEEDGDKEVVEEETDAAVDPILEYYAGPAN